ncbi:MmcQ/YjbR family DNA-binding protein [Streptococcus macacae]|uniref:PF04237 family protein n=1 Tax=Streptococcus macacae NCTC 11558 TaxID=764298 RepID=G5JUH9_9STRE|nr:MmcQ/YjbR family DNA-binding protein [Streptococcus macacae]EHJ52201.1 hypothetical protein STRMA_0806 [Streptococcus macacae NCTC 11558]SUN78621.1 MmcQ family protein [Streptococcus macacae NCTC 11558]
MKLTKKELIALVLMITNGYEDYPFKRKGREHAAIRHHHNQKILAIILEQDSRLLLSLKLKPEQVEEYLNDRGIMPAIGLNKKHWLTIAVNETEVTQEELKQMLLESSRLTRK